MIDGQLFAIIICAIILGMFLEQLIVTIAVHLETRQMVGNNECFVRGVHPCRNTRKCHWLFIWKDKFYCGGCSSYGFGFEKGGETK